MGSDHTSHQRRSQPTCLSGSCAPRVCLAAALSSSIPPTDQHFLFLPTSHTAEVRLDHGAQLIHPDALKQDTPFAREVASAVSAGALAHWTAFDGGAAVIGTPGINALPKYLAQGLDVHTGVPVANIERSSETGLWQVRTGVPPPLPGVPPSQVASSAYGASQTDTLGPFDELVLAVPPIQAHALLGTAAAPAADVDVAALQQTCASVTMAPCLAALFVFPRALDTSKVAVKAGNDSTGAIAWAASGRGRAGSPDAGLETWVAHATPAWSQAHLEDQPKESAAALLPHLLALLGIGETASVPAPLHINGQRWRFSQLAGDGVAGQAFARQARGGLSLCGDWFVGRRLEHAYASGYALGEALAGQQPEA